MHPGQRFKPFPDERCQIILDTARETFFNGDETDIIQTFIHQRKLFILFEYIPPNSYGLTAGYL